MEEIVGVLTSHKKYSQNAKLPIQPEVWK